MAVTIGTIGTIITVGAAAARVAGPLFRATTTAAQRLMANNVETQTPNKNVDHVFGSNNQTLFNSAHHHNKVAGLVAAAKTLEKDVSNVPTFKPKGGPQAGG